MYLSKIWCKYGAKCTRIFGQLLEREGWGIEDAREIYTHIYPQWDIAFDRIFGYTDFVEILMISTPHIRVAISSGHV